MSDPAGHGLTTGNDPQGVSVATGATSTAAGVGFQPHGWWAGHVFTDTDGDGVQDAAGSRRSQAVP